MKGDDKNDNEKDVPKESKDKQSEEGSKEVKEEGGETEQEGKDGDKSEEDIFIPQAEYTAVCNADFLPMICNDFIQEFMEKEHGAC